jgi:hypothetical protein
LAQVIDQHNFFFSLFLVVDVGMRVEGGSTVQQDESVATSGDKWQRFWDGKQGKFPCRSSIIELKFGLMDSGGLARGRIIYWLSSEVEQNFVDFLPKVALILARFQLFSTSRLVPKAYTDGYQLKTM